MCQIVLDLAPNQPQQQKHCDDSTATCVSGWIKFHIDAVQHLNFYIEGETDTIGEELFDEIEACAGISPNNYKSNRRAHTPATPKSAHFIAT